MKIPYAVIQEAWAVGTNACRRKSKAMGEYPYSAGHPLQLVNPGDMRKNHAAGVEAAAKVLLAWMKKTSRK